MSRSNYTEYTLIFFSLFSLLLCWEAEKADIEADEVRFPGEEDPHAIGISYQPICNELPHYKKLAEKVMALSTDFEERLSKLETEVTNLKKELKVCQTVNDKLDGEMQEIKKGDASYKGKVEEQVEALQKKLQKYFTKLSDAEKEVEEMDQNLSNRNKQLIGLEDKYETMDDDLKKLKSTLQELTKKNEEIDKTHVEKMTKIVKKVEELSQNMTTYEGYVNITLTNVTTSMEILNSKNEATKSDEDATIVKPEEVVISVKRFKQAIQRHTLSNSETTFQVSNESVKSSWKFYLKYMEDKNCEYSLDCRYVGAFVELLSAESEEPIAAKFTLLFRDAYGNEIKSQNSSLKAFRKSEKFGWRNWVPVEELIKYVDTREAFQAVLMLQLYPRDSYLYEEERINELRKESWDLPNLYFHPPDTQTKNVTLTFSMGYEIGTYTRWKIYLKSSGDYLGVGVSLIESYWKVAYASWKMKFLDLTGSQVADSKTYVNEYRVGAPAIKDSHFISWDKVRWHQRHCTNENCFKIEIDFILYGKDAKLYRNVIN